jgi:LPXTG-motif cell wall-anchored protein
MYKKIIGFALAVLCSTYIFADTPGKATMHESKITFQAIKDIAGYTFYWAMERGGEAGALTTDTSLIMAGSQGAPYRYLFWGINDINRRSTDTIEFHNYYSPDYVIILNAVKEDSIYYTKKELSNANDIVSEGNTDSIANKQLIADAKSAKRKHYIKISLFIVAGVAALGGLVWYFIRRRKKKAIVS